MSQELSQFLNRFLSKHSLKKFDLLDFFIDTSVSKKGEGEIVPYLNVLLANFFPDDNMMQLLNEAKENEDIGFFYDGLDLDSKGYYESYFEFELSDIREDWSHIANVDADEFVSILEKSLGDNKGNIKNIKSIIFHFVDDLNVRFLKSES